ncbi:MAG: glycosyl hydrolase 115 family protein [Pseudobacter sp.]|uniref:glycosyl hydrolase 115 family protein n=1 Tax=Pseudobacter sp. TaxID=2045420 RepID=UPI003F7E20DD
MKLLISHIILSAALVLIFSPGHTQSIVAANPGATTFSLKNASIYVEKKDHPVVQKAAQLLQDDIQLVTGKKPPLTHTATGKPLIIIGSADKSAIIRKLAAQKKLSLSAVDNRWEAFHISNLSNTNTLVITGSDARGTAFGVLEFSKHIGVSPWYWWADVPVVKKKEIHINRNISIIDSPLVKYRGIFLNDEAPALSNWSRMHFGGFRYGFYEKVFELMLRLKANYIWPAMWGNAFYDDDSLNIKMAEQYAIVIGTSHHEPLMRAHDEWRRYGQGRLWNYDSSAVALRDFWRTGLQRASNEKLVTLGMRGDGDEPMSQETATSLLERIIADQRTIIEEVTGKKANQTPQLWALYKEVQDYYDKGMRVPDDVTLLLCDDNWGNIRRLPRPGSQPRKGGYGIYYHFDYVGGPRNYKWINTNPLPRVWEQMHLAWEHDVKQIWIVNVGDLKPMELPISFFLDYAWNPTRISASAIQDYTAQWAAQQFGDTYKKDIAQLLAGYAKVLGRCKPELLNAQTYSLFREWKSIVDETQQLRELADDIATKIPADYHNAYFQLVHHPVLAVNNLYEMYYYTALNQNALSRKWKQANQYADSVKLKYETDSLISVQYHQLNNGKWNHMMSQTHIGYTNWQQPLANKMPLVGYLNTADALPGEPIDTIGYSAASMIPRERKDNCFFQFSDYVSMSAAHYTSAVNSNGISWTILPDHGRTGDAITAFPVTAPRQQPGNNSPRLSYDFYISKADSFDLAVYCSPTLNIYHDAEGLQFAISIDEEIPELISLNKNDNNPKNWNNWVANNIIIRSTKRYIGQPGRHTLHFWMVDPAVVLQKLELYSGNAVPGYLGFPETLKR